MRRLNIKPIATPAMFWVTLLAVALVIASCAGGGRNVGQPGMGAQGPSGAGQGATVKVALLLPLGGSGSSAKVAQALKQAGELALFDFDDPNVSLIAKDTKGTAEGAREAAEAAVQDGAELILGPIFSQEVAAAAPVAREAGTPMIAFSSDQKVAGGGVYLLSFLPGRDVPRMVDYAASRGKRNFAALIPRTEYGQLVEGAFTRAVAQAGGQVMAVEHYGDDANAMMEPVKKIAELATGPGSRVDVLFMPGGPETLPTLATTIPYFEIDTEAVQIVGTGQWDYPTVGKVEPLHGAWFPAPDPDGGRSFTQNYVQTYEESPPRIASLAYDAVSLAVSLSSGPEGQRFTPERLTRQSGFAGVDGLFRLRSDGTSERGLAVLEVRSGGAVVIDPAPTSFSMAQY